MKKAELSFNIVLVVVDFIMLLAASVAAYYLRISPWLEGWRQPQEFFLRFPFSVYFPVAILVSAVWIVIFFLAGLYRSRFGQSIIEDFTKVVLATLAGVAAVTLFFFFNQELFDSRFILLAAWFFSLVLVTMGRFAIKKVWARFRLGTQRTVLVGPPEVVGSLAAAMAADPYIERRAVAKLTAYNEKELNRIKDDEGFDEVMVCDEKIAKEQLAVIADYCENNNLNFRFIPDLFQTFFININVETIAGFPVLEFNRTPLEGWGRFSKRAVDAAVAAAGIVLFLPFWVAVAAVITLDSPGPALVKLKRVSRGKEFCLYKFRSMKNNSQELKSRYLEHNERKDGPLFKIKNDPRVTRAGKYLRRTWIDEFPQLINVLKGEMSLVGPRPHEPEEVACYQKRHKGVFFVKSGMTGISQVSGSSSLPFEEEVKLDLYYVKNWSMIWDFKIILKTMVLFFKQKASY